MARKKQQPAPEARSIMPFWQFCELVLGLTLTLGQRVIAKVAFGDQQPKDLEGEEREIALQMFGGASEVPENAKKYVAMRLGRGSGKTTMCAAYAIYCAVTHDISKVGPGDVPRVIVVAPDKETAVVTILMVREMVRLQPALEAMVTGEQSTHVILRRLDGRLVKIEALAATKGGKSGRGRTIMTFICDEAEFFGSNEGTGGQDYAVNDSDVVKALKPRLLRNGKGLFISTPWPVETYMGKMFDENWGKPTTAVAIKAPTILVRGEDPDIRAMVEDELARDPENARRELFCEVDHVSSDSFFDIYALRSSLRTVFEYPEPFNPKWPVAVGVDFGFTRDSSAIVVVQFDGERYRTVFIDEMRPSPGAPLKPSDVIERFSGIAKRYGCSSVISDAYYREAIREGLLKHGLGLIDAPAGTQGKAEVYQRTRAMVHEGRCTLPDVDLGKRLVQQAKLVVSKASPGGQTTVRSPRRVGMGHGDIVSAWTLAVHRLATSRVAQDRVVLEPGTPEWLAESSRRILSAEEKRWKAYVKDMERQVKATLPESRLRRMLGR